MIIIVGLGNPGPQYEETRHNTGFLAASKLAELLKANFQREGRLHSLIARPSSKDILIVKPQTFMNRSGLAVAAIANFYQVAPDNIWVLYDDVDLPVGTARVRGRGLGRTKHKGLLSIASALGTHGFPRFRIGIAQTGESAQAADRPHEPITLKDFVLQPFDRREIPQVEKAITWVIQEVQNALKRGAVVSKTLTKGV